LFTTCLLTVKLLNNANNLGGMSSTDVEKEEEASNNINKYYITARSLIIDSNNEAMPPDAPLSSAAQISCAISQI
jgi:hypothetical protein